MTTLYIILGLTAVTGFALWLAVRHAKELGRAEEEAKTNKRMAENAEARGQIVAEHRDPERTSDRLRDGTF